MKRLHIHIGVDDIDASVRFYSTLFGAAPTEQRADYARWMLDDPRVNLAIGSRCGSRGVEHLGIQAETAAELEEVFRRGRETGAPIADEGETTCCYAQSRKQWITDPMGVQWEAFLTEGYVEQYYGSRDQ